MSERKISVKIDPLGRPTIEAHGFAGQGCEEATKSIEEALAGGDAQVSKVIKDEWHETADAAQEQTQSW